MTTPLVSFVIPVLNAETDLRGCLDSIRNQVFDSLEIEIIVVDGGSTDSTRDIAMEANAIVVQNPYRLAEPGVSVGMSVARGRFVTVMAADNRIASPHFIRRMVEAFELPRIGAALPRVVSTNADSLISRYINSYSDPFSYFVYRVPSPQATGTRASGYRVLETSVKHHPLLAIAQGCTVRAGLVYRRAPEDADDVLAIVELISDGYDIAVVDGATIEHHTAGNLLTFFRKSRTRARLLLSRDQGYFRRRTYLNWRRRLRGWIWFPYSASLILPIIDALVGSVKRRDPVFLFHPIANTTLFLAVSSELALFAARRMLSKGVIRTWKRWFAA
jgi:glycosyltransferase involved in cell wall biosynthesis